jgi:hypothetical protein
MPKVLSLSLSLSLMILHILCARTDIGTHVRMYTFNIDEYMHKYKTVFFYATIALVGNNMI